MKQHWCTDNISSNYSEEENEIVINANVLECMICTYKSENEKYFKKHKEKMSCFDILYHFLILFNEHY